MNIFGLEIRRRRPRRVLVKVEQMSEEQIDAALANVPETDAYQRAVLQLIETARENAMSFAATEPREWQGDYVGAAEHLRMLREEILQRRSAELRRRQR